MRFGSFVFGTIIVGALVGWFAPVSPEREPTGAAGPDAREAQREDRLDAVRRDQWLAGEVVLPRAGDGHFYAEVSTDFGNARMLVDTGASVIALTASDAAAMGVDWRESDVRPIARGASGDVYGVPVMLERVEVDGIEVRGVQAVVVPEGLDVSLLGQSFLAKVKRVEVNGDEMLLHD